MEDTQITTSSVISFAERLEDGSAAFYEALAGQFADKKDKFLGFAKESRLNKQTIVRTYQETISDALEACFVFEGMSLQDFAPQAQQGATGGDSLRAAVELEDKAVKFYQETAERSQALLATIPRAFRRVADKRAKRKAELQALLEKA